MFALFHTVLSSSEHRYVELFLNSTAGGSNGGYGGQMMGAMGEFLWEVDEGIKVYSGPTGVVLCAESLWL